MRRAWRENPNTLQMTLLEEDSYLDVEYMRELGRLLREDEEFGLGHYNFYCLTSNQSLSQWDMDEVMLTGCSTVFIGVESKFAPQEGYHKRKGRDIADTFRDLHQRGIMTTGALMLGFDFQNPQNLDEDMAHFVSLQPTMQQIARVCPFPEAQARATRSSRIALEIRAFGPGWCRVLATAPRRPGRRARGDPSPAA